MEQKTAYFWISRKHVYHWNPGLKTHKTNYANPVIIRNAKASCIIYPSSYILNGRREKGGITYDFGMLSFCDIWTGVVE